MKYRTSELLAAKSITTAGTEVLDINVREPISRLTAIVRLTNAAYVPTQHPVRAITTIQLVDGADIIHSMRGCYTQSLAFYGTREQPFNYINYIDNGLAVASCPIYFGRRLWDAELALLPDRFNNLQLKIAHNYAAGGASPDAATLEVWADLFDDDPPSPRGFLSGQSIWSKTLVASTIDYVELPNDQVIRLVMPCVSSSSEEPDINIDAVRITEEHDKKIVYDIGVLEQLQMVESRWPQWHEFFEGRGFTTAEEYYLTPAKDSHFPPVSEADNDAYWNSIWSGGQQRQVVASVNGINFTSDVTGRCPHGAIPFPMGMMDEIDSWWDVTKLGSARVRMTTGGGDTSSLYELIIQQMRQY